jgi:EAL and modified HD-GYP domain-containing signal transduction protein
VKKIKDWATLIVLTSIDNKPRELFVMSLQRAKYCQLLAQVRGAPNIDAYFTAGLFSTLDALLDKPFAELVPQLSLADELNQALLERSGLIGEVLTAVIAYEQAAWDTMALADIAPAQMRECYLEAVRWARDAAQQLTSK